MVFYVGVEEARSSDISVVCYSLGDDGLHNERGHLRPSSVRLNYFYSITFTQVKSLF